MCYLTESCIVNTLIKALNTSKTGLQPLTYGYWLSISVQLGNICYNYKTYDFNVRILYSKNVVTGVSQRRQNSVATSRKHYQVTLRTAHDNIKKAMHWQLITQLVIQLFMANPMRISFCHFSSTQLRDEYFTDNYDDQKLIHQQQIG